MRRVFQQLSFTLFFLYISPLHAQMYTPNQIPLVLRYEDSSRDFVPLSPRRRRATYTSIQEPVDMWNSSIPKDVGVEEDAADHQYYVMNIYTNKPEQLKKYWVDIDEMLKRPEVTGNDSHPLLSGCSYRRAVGAKLSFKFPFYGHLMNNLTIATGGFLYIGDLTHNWLAATQYIAPLMANFNTCCDGANILFADDGQKFVVEWRKVQLRGQGEEGPFTFQVSLFKNGNIALVYKDVPMPVANISDDDHPVKCGISDAYLYEHAFTGQGTLPPKRVIYEYHRIEIPPPKIVSYSVVFLEAQPTCILLDSCESCSNATLKHFSCSWCHAKKKHDGPFCTDQGGLHRRRQHWAENNCKTQGKNMYCSDSDENELENDDTSSSTPGRSSSPDDVISLDKDTKSDSLKGRTEGSGYAALVFLLGCSLCLIGWLAYAYYNPHTTSGQLLIKYRPSRWRVPSSHVRYSASVHM